MTEMREKPVRMVMTVLMELMVPEERTVKMVLLALTVLMEYPVSVLV